MNDRLQALTDQGVSIWLDDISVSGCAAAADLIKTHNLVGVTSNPTIFAKAVADADDYEDQVKDLAARGVDLEEAVRAITTFDVRWACDVMRDVRATARTAASVSRSTRGSPRTPRRRSRRPAPCGGWWTGPTP